jgi:hypothetical protein
MTYTFVQISKHAPETCPEYNPKYRAMTLNWFETIDSMAAKYGIKVIGNWTDHPAHTVMVVYEAPSLDNLMGLMMEPSFACMMAFCTTKVTPVMTAKDTYGMIKQAK